MRGDVAWPETSETADQARPVDRATPRRGGYRDHPGGAFAIAGLAYLLLSVALWSGVWVHHPTTATTCGCGDASLFTWFLAWPAHAIAHALNPFYSTALFHPQGINLLANTGVVAIGVALAPVTWLFGPVATLNVALTLSPVLSGLAMFVLLRRWVTWVPAAFVGGLFYGFSPFILVSLTDAHLMIGMALVPPLFVACLDEILIRQRRRPMAVGLALGVLVTLQFFIGSEAFVIMVAAGTVGVGLVIGYAALRQPSTLRARAHYAVVAFAVAGVVAVVLLAYPVWFALAGPAHYSGAIWPNFGLGYQGSTVNGLIHAIPPSKALFGTAYNHRVGGYQGTILSDQYFGFGVLVVVVGGLVAMRRDRRMWLFGVITLLSVAAAWGLQPGSWTPWRLVASLPILEDIIPNRILIVTCATVAVMLGLVVDHTHRVLAGRPASPHAGADPSARPSSAARHPKGRGVLAATLVSAVALIPIVTFLAPGVPFTTEPVVLPTWFRVVAPHLPAHQVLLVFPAPVATIESSMTWQAVNTMHYAMVGGGGPSAVLSRGGSERKGQAVIARVSYSFGFAQKISTDDIVAVRDALHGWGVTMVVIPDQSDLPAYDQPQSVTLAAALITAATGRAPRFQAEAWVWSGVDRPRSSTPPATAAFSACTAGAAARGEPAVLATTRCLLSRLGRST
jgi:hypothetical protein